MLAHALACKMLVDYPARFREYTSLSRGSRRQCSVGHLDSWNCVFSGMDIPPTVVLSRGDKRMRLSLDDLEVSLFQLLNIIDLPRRLCRAALQE